MSKIATSLVLDGGLATQLQNRGNRLDSKLWSAELLVSKPGEIEAVHLEYLRAGADIVTTASYQATIRGFQDQGLDRQAGVRLLQSSVSLAKDVRDRFWDQRLAGGSRRRPQVAASVGPFGAYLANGAEYTGDYDLDYQGLMEFHRQRWEILASEAPDLLLCETVPSFLEAQVLSALAETVSIPVWLSFCCRDTMHIADGTRLQTCIRWLEDQSSIRAVGVNCVEPERILTLAKLIRAETSLPVIVYPNSGEVYDAVARTWSGDCLVDTFKQQAAEWVASGINVVGGCCRTTPKHIAALRALVDTRN